MSKSMECPVNYYEDNLYFNSAKSCWAAYKLCGFNYDYQGNNTQLNILVSLTQMIKCVAHAKIMIIPTTEDVESHYGRLKSKIRTDDILHDDAMVHAELTCRYLVQAGQDGNDYTTFLLVKIQEEFVDEIELAGKHILEFLKSPLNGLTSLLLLSPEDITTAEFEMFKTLEAEIFQTLNSSVELLRLETNETQWLLKRVNYKGIKAPVKLHKTVKEITDEYTGKFLKQAYSEEWTPLLEKEVERKVEYYRPHKSDIANLFSGRLRCEGNKGISINHDDGTVSYQSYLVMTNIPEAITFPGKEWIYNLLKQPRQIEFCIDIKNVYHKKAEEMLTNKQTEVNTQIENIQKANAQIPSKLLEATVQIESLKRELSDNKLPMSKTVVTICVSGTDKEQVENEVKELKLYLDKNDFSAERPGADQLKLYLQHIPGSESYADNFIKKLSPFIVAGGVFGVNNRVGDNIGRYIGVANGKFVYLDILLACLENKSPACTIYGDLGYGKSFNANLILFLHVLYGGRGLVICPKGERSHWKNIPCIGEHTNVVELTTESKNKGKLDPFNVFDDIEMASESAMNIFINLLDIKTNENRYVVLTESIQKNKKSQRPSMLNIVSIIGRVDKTDVYHADAERLYRGLIAMKDSGIFRILFGDGTEEAISINGRLNVITLQGVSLPDKDTPQEKYTQEQRLSNTLFEQVANISKKFALMFRGVPKMSLLDESWVLKATTTGSALIEWHARMGRALYHAIVLNGHSVLDLPNEQLRTTMTYKFCFHTSDEDEAKRMLEYLKLDITRENINTLMRLKNGECLFSDLYGRVSRLQFDAVFGDIIKFFSTTPEPEASPQSINSDFSSEPAPEPEETEKKQTPQEADILVIHKKITTESANDTADILEAVTAVLNRNKTA